MKLNRLRFEALREDRQGTGLVAVPLFRTLLKRLGVSVSSQDLKDMQTYFASGAGNFQQ